MKEQSINDFSDRFPPYGGEKEYSDILKEYVKVFGGKINIPYSSENYGKVYDAINMGKPIGEADMDIDKIAKKIIADVKEIPYNKDILRLRIQKGSFLGPNFYARTQDKLEKALNNNVDVKIFMTEAGGPYGSNVVVDIAGVRYPLTKGKIRNRDFYYFFGVNV